MRHVEPDPTAELIGQTIGGGYRIDRLLGTGGFGAVYRATQLSMRRPVAMKLLHSRHLRDRRQFRRFYKEAEAASRLSSPHVVRVHDFGVDDERGLPFIVMEYLQGHVLSDLIDPASPCDPRRACEVLSQVARALADAQQHNIVHRDLKPDNIFLLSTATGEDFVKVMDFGIAKIYEPETGESDHLTSTGAAIGTPRYMSPEQVMSSQVDSRSDFYSLGCILHELLTGRPLFDAADRLSLVMMHVSNPPPELPAMLPTGKPRSQALHGLHQALLAKEPDNRPASATDLVAFLAALGRGAEPGGDLVAALAPTDPISDALEGTTAAMDELPFEPEAPALPIHDLSDLAGQASSAKVVVEAPAAPQGGSDSEEAGWDDDEPTKALESSSAVPSPSIHPAPGAPTDSTTGAIMAAEVRRRLQRGRRRLQLGAAAVAALFLATAVAALLPDDEVASRPISEGAAGDHVEAPGVEPAPPSAPTATSSPPAADARVDSAPTDGSMGGAPDTASAPVQPPAPDAAPPEPASPAKKTRRKKARIQIFGGPAGARVTLGGRTLCTLPCDVEVRARGGATTLRITHPGYATTTLKGIRLKAGSRTRKRVVLARTLKF